MVHLVTSTIEHRVASTSYLQCGPAAKKCVHSARKKNATILTAVFRLFWRMECYVRVPWGTFPLLGTCRTKRCVPEEVGGTCRKDRSENTSSCCAQNARTSPQDQAKPSWTRQREIHA